MRPAEKLENLPDSAFLYRFRTLRKPELATSAFDSRGLRTGGIYWHFRFCMINGNIEEAEQILRHYITHYATSSYPEQFHRARFASMIVDCGLRHPDYTYRGLVDTVTTCIKSSFFYNRMVYLRASLALATGDEEYTLAILRLRKNNLLNRSVTGAPDEIINTPEENRFRVLTQALEGLLLYRKARLIVRGDTLDDDIDDLSKRRYAREAVSVMDLPDLRMTKLQPEQLYEAHQYRMLSSAAIWRASRLIRYHPDEFGNWDVFVLCMANMLLWVEGLDEVEKLLRR